MKQIHFEQGRFHISASASPVRGHIFWRGISDARDPGAFIEDVNKKVAEFVRGVDVTLDFTELEYMNSATVAPMLSLVKRLDAGGQRVVLVFSSADWQRTHMMCMKTISRTLRHVTVETRAA